MYVVCISIWWYDWGPIGAASDDDTNDDDKHHRNAGNDDDRDNDNDDYARTRSHHANAAISSSSSSQQHLHHGDDNDGAVNGSEMDAERNEYKSAETRERDDKRATEAAMRLHSEDPGDDEKSHKVFFLGKRNQKYVTRIAWLSNRALILMTRSDADHLSDFVMRKVISKVHLKPFVSFHGKWKSG
jgi:hypothetical protein